MISVFSKASSLRKAQTFANILKPIYQLSKLQLKRSYSGPNLVEYKISTKRPAPKKRSKRAMSQQNDASGVKSVVDKKPFNTKQQVTQNVLVEHSTEITNSTSSVTKADAKNYGQKNDTSDFRTKFQKYTPPFQQARRNPFKGSTGKFVNTLDQLPLQSIISVLGEKPDQQLFDGIAKARSQIVESYLEKLDQSRKHHPILQNQDKFNYLADSIRTVNSQRTALISVDLEAFEGNTKIITEIGLSIYDPFKEATSLLPSLVNIHIILQEAHTLRNGKFVHDHKDNFLGGNSLVLSQKTAVDFIQTLFTFYFQARQKDGFGAAFVAHNGSGDVKWLTQMGVQIPDNYKMLDTEKIYTYTHGANGNSLGAILRRFHIPHSFLHNAGNDAYFTLIALLKLTDPHFRTAQK